MEDITLRALRVLGEVQILAVKIPESMTEFQQLQGQTLRRFIGKKGGSDIDDLQRHLLYQGFMPAIRRQAILKELGNPEKIVLKDSIRGHPNLWDHLLRSGCAAKRDGFEPRSGSFILPACLSTLREGKHASDQQPQRG